MKLSKVSSAIAAALSSLAFATPSFADIHGYFDCVTVGSADIAKGWVCVSTDPANTPSYGQLSVFVNDNHHSDHSLAYGEWSQYYPAVNGAGYCGTHAYVGFALAGFYYSPSATIKVKFKDNQGNYTNLFGPVNGYTMTGPGTFGTCQF